jgi:hypothetical protein
MQNGKITGNPASTSISFGSYTTSDYGNGVYVAENGINNSSFSKTGGIIYGDDNSNSDNGNVADNTDRVGNTLVHVVFFVVYDQNSIIVSEYYRNGTLAAADGINAVQVLASGTGYNWTRKWR